MITNKGLTTPHMLLTDWRAWLITGLWLAWGLVRFAWFGWRVLATLGLWPVFLVAFEGRTLLLLPELDRMHGRPRFTLTDKPFGRKR